jgi:excisionase family DNA binding protein
MEEIFELIKAFNRLRDKITELSSRIDLITESPKLPPEGDYFEESFACKFLHISQSTLVRLRKSKSIPFTKFNRKILYKKTDLNEFLEKKSKGKMS